MAKFPILYRILLEEHLISQADVMEPEMASWEALSLVHTEDYLSKLREGTLTRKEERKLGLPWSKQLVRRSRLAVQGTINATYAALEDGIAANLAGGTHHAFADHGEGFCVLNDIAVAIRTLKNTNKIQRALIVDLDVHQGNGTAAIFKDEPDVFTFSMHGERNYPFNKQKSSRDVGLEDGMEDTDYLKILRDNLEEVIEESKPDIVLYLDGVDVVKRDRFGRLCLTRNGLMARGRYALETIVRDKHIPLTLLLSGGYAKTAHLTADLHAMVHRVACTLFY